MKNTHMKSAKIILAATVVFIGSNLYVATAEAAPATKLIIQFATSTPATAGMSKLLSIKAVDEQNTADTTYNPEGKTFSFKDSNGNDLSAHLSPNGTLPTIPDSNEIIQAFKELKKPFIRQEDFALSKLNLVKAESLGTITVSDGTLSGTSNNIAVLHNTPVLFSVIVSPLTPTTNDLADITVTATDAFGNVTDGANGATPFAGVVLFSTNASAATWHTQVGSMTTGATKTFVDAIRFNTVESGVNIKAENNNMRTPVTGTLNDITVTTAPDTTIKGVLGVTGITAVKTFASADNTFESGWKWVFDVTVPANEPVVSIKFADWTNGADTIPAAGNIRFYSAQFTNATDAAHAISIVTAGTYGEAANLNTGIDLDVSRAGQQIQVVVEARIPTGSTGGSYSTSYGIRSVSDTVAPVITLNGESPVSVTIGAAYTDAGATALDNFDGDISPKIVTENLVNTSSVGEYRVTYNVKDAKENAATEVVRTIHVVANKSLLTSAIAEARKLYDAAVEGSRVGQYRAGAKAALLSVIEDAVSVEATAKSSPAEVEEWRQKVEDALTGFDTAKITDDTPPSLTEFSVSESRITLNGDNVKDTVTIDVKFSERVNAKITIVDASGAKVRELYRNDAVTDPQPKPWDGKNDDGAFVAGGIYTLVVSATDAAGNTATNREKTVAVVNFMELASAVARALSLNELTAEGTASGQYPPAIKQAFTTAIEDAMNTSDNPNETQPEIDRVLILLNQAIVAFEAGKVQ